MNPLYQNPHTAGCPWFDAAQTFGAPNIKWCEATLCRWISEPANTWSNIPYLIIGVIIFLQMRKNQNYELRWMGPAFFLMGLFSFFYHASNFYISQIFDFIGMYLFVFWLLVINLRRVGWIARKAQIGVLIGLTVGCTILVHIMYLYGIKFQIIIAVAVAAIIGTEILARKKHPDNVGSPKNFLIGLFFIAAAQTASLMDLKRVPIICNPDNHWFQGHALWHVLAAIGLYFAYLHYRALRYDEA